MIKKLEQEKVKWENSNYIRDISISNNLKDRTVYFILDVTFINFKRLKEDTLNTINKRIKEYQEEFDNL
nr:MAG TPA: hypothetical protein [Crassvirales sp.]